MTSYLINGKIILEFGILPDHILVLENGKIKEIVFQDKLTLDLLQGKDVIDLQGGYICPGWIDIHCHGAVGTDTMDADLQGMLRVAEYKATQGVTGFIPTGVTSSLSKMEKAISVVSETVLKNERGAQILGFHIEGPFINPVRKGAHQEDLIIPTDAEWTRKIKENLAGKLIVTVAPEMPGALDYIRQISKEGVLVAIGHSNGTYDDIKGAYEAGATHIVHTFNGMKELHHREPGVVGAAMDLSIAAELIMDGIHVHPVTARILSRLKLPHDLILVTDAMRAAGLEDGEYDLGGLKVYKRGKEARLADGTLAGSTLTMQEAVQNSIRLVGLSIVDVCKMASTNPARVLGLDQKGSIVVGKDADLTLLNPDLEVIGTVIEGQVVYKG